MPVNRTRRFVLLLAGLALAIAASVCGRGDPLAGEPPCDALRLQEPPQQRSVVILLSDTLRRDRPGAYGGPARTPAFDRLADGALLFTDATSQAPWTKPSVATLFTSLYPSQHGVLSHPLHDRALGGHDALPEASVTLAEVFRAAGYATGAFVANPFMDERFGFAQGFDTYDDSFARWDAHGGEVSRAALAWIRQQPEGAPWLAYAHYIDAHQPYPPLSYQDLFEHADRLSGPPLKLPGSVRRRIALSVRLEGGASLRDARIEPTPALVRLAYDKGVEQFDAGLATFLDGLARMPGGDEAIVILTSDHGEALFDRGYGNHGRGLHDDELGVPLVIRWPGVSPARGRVDCQVGLIDLLPTLCAGLGLPCEAAMEGRPFVRTPGAGRSGGGPRYLAAEGVGGKPRNRAVRNRRFKLISQPDGAPYPSPPPDPLQLYDLAEDPGERTDLLRADPRPPLVERALERLRRALADAVRPMEVAPAERIPATPELEERLRALGYVE